jgi:hypothetical protein
LRRCGRPGCVTTVSLTRPGGRQQGGAAANQEMSAAEKTRGGSRMQCGAHLSWRPDAYGEGTVSALFLISVACPQASMLRAAPPLDRPANPARPGGGYWGIPAAAIGVAGLFRSARPI